MLYSLMLTSLDNFPRQQTDYLTTNINNYIDDSCCSAVFPSTSPFLSYSTSLSPHLGQPLVPERGWQSKTPSLYWVGRVYVPPMSSRYAMLLNSTSMVLICQ